MSPPPATPARRISSEEERLALIRIPLSASLLVALAAAPLCSGGAFEEEMLAAHNVVRQQVSVPRLGWSRKLAAVAQKWADHLLATGRFEHQANNPHGENLFEARGQEATPLDVVAAWAAEAYEYDYRTNTCRGRCGHYTQLVWRTTREVGCASASRGLRQVVVCEYSPPGNWVGQRPW